MITKLRALMSAVEYGSLKAAAEALGCTQSAVSHSIASLEEELGFRLLRRGRSGIRLTDEGERLLGAVRAVEEDGKTIRLGVLTIPGSVVRIGAGAFADCSCLTDMTLYTGVEEIGDGAFDTHPGTGHSFSVRVLRGEGYAADAKVSDSYPARWCIQHHVKMEVPEEKTI